MWTRLDLSSLFDGHLGLVEWTTKANMNFKILVHRTFGEYGIVVEDV
jgi:hypothetical protein